jgi:photosystem II stability/assembly factor-like uncharacterized protein
MSFFNPRTWWTVLISCLISGLLLTGQLLIAQQSDPPAETAQQTESNEAQPQRTGLRQRAAARARAAEEGVVSQQAAMTADANNITPALPQAWLDQVPWRSIGPANMGGRIVALAVVPSDPHTWWAATASGGLLKTTNNGITFEHQFDKETTVSIGDVQVSPSHPNIVWVGTGEHNPRNSSSWGDGVYKSEDGGKTWTNMGLKETFQIGRIAIHPENPDIVWVGALGRLWGPNPQRGLFKSTDGGQTWRKVLYINQDTGVIDVKLNPGNPDEMLIATYERRRAGFDDNDPVVRFGAGSGIYKSVDGGESFKKINSGLPTCKMGRIGIDYFQADPKVVVALVESEKIARLPDNWAFLGLRGEDAEVGAKITAVTPNTSAEKAGLQTDDIILMLDGQFIGNYPSMMQQVRQRVAGDKIKLLISRNKQPLEIELELDKIPEGQQGRTQNPFTGELGGQAANLQDQQGDAGFQYGGVYVSEDGGDSWTRVNSLNPRPMYFSHIRIDPVDRNNLYVCGVNLFRSFDGGKTFRGDGGTQGIHVDHHTLWINPNNPKHILLGNDGGIYMTYDRMEHWDHYSHFAIGQFYHVGVDSRRDYNVYGGLQDNGSWGGPSRGKHGEGPVNSDWFRVGGGDGFVTLVDPEDHNQVYYESQNGFMGRIHLETGERASLQPREQGQRFRFNWKTPFTLSPHNSRTFYSAGNYVFKSTQRGSNQRRISPEIPLTNQGSGSAISESPFEEGVLYVGTTDGAVWVTRDGGQNWTSLYAVSNDAPAAAANDEGKNAEAANAAEGTEPMAQPAAAVQAQADTPAETAQVADPTPAQPDGISGQWKGVVNQEELAGEGLEFTLSLKKDQAGQLSGTIESPMGQLPITSGQLIPEKNEIEIWVQTDEIAFEIKARINEDNMAGTVDVGNGQMVMDFSAQRIRDDQHDPTDQPDQAQEGYEREIHISQSPGQLPGESLSFQFFEDRTGLTLRQIGLNGDDSLSRLAHEFSLTSMVRSGKRLASPGTDDPVSGTWKGSMSSERGDTEVTLVMKLNPEGKVTGSFESPRGSRDLTGQFNAESKKLSLTVDAQQFSLEFDGKLENEQYKGEIDFQGQFSMDFSFQRQAKSTTAESTTAESTTAESEGDAPSSQTESQIVPRRQDRESGIRGQRGLRGAVGGPRDRTAESGSVPTSPDSDQSLSRLLPGPRWVSSLEASRFRAGRCYITFDGHRSDDDGIYLFVTEDYGQTWKSLRGNLPDSAGSVHVLREDVRNENLLYLGCEFSAWVSIDRGQSWTQIKGDFPTVAVHEFAVHPIAGEVVAGTHGRSLWIADVTQLRQFSQETIAAPMHLYQPAEVLLWRTLPERGDTGPRRFVGTNPPRTASITYSLAGDAQSTVLTIRNLRGEVIKTFEAPKSAGLHKINWQLDSDPRSGTESAGAGPGGRRGQTGRRVAPGDYLVVLQVDGREQSQVISIRNATD